MDNRHQIASDAAHIRTLIETGLGQLALEIEEEFWPTTRRAC